MGIIPGTTPTLVLTLDESIAGCTAAELCIICDNVRILRDLPELAISEDGTAKIGSSRSSKVGFFGTTPDVRQTLSTTSQNQGYTSATASNYLTIINKIAGILKKLGLLA